MRYRIIPVEDDYYLLESSVRANGKVAAICAAKAMYDSALTARSEYPNYKVAIVEERQCAYGHFYPRSDYYTVRADYFGTICLFRMKVGYWGPIREELIEAI